MNVLSVMMLGLCSITAAFSGSLLNDRPVKEAVTVSINAIDISIGETASVFVQVSDLSGEGIGGYQFTLVFDPGVLSVTGVNSAATLSEGMFVSSNTPSPGELRVVAAGSAEMSGAGTLLELIVQPLASGTSSLVWSAFQFDNTNVSTTLIDGAVTVSGSSSAPMASFLATPMSGVAPLDVEFDANGSTDGDNDIVSYSWDFDDGSQSTGIETNHTFVTSGSFDVALTVIDGQGNLDTTTRTISVSSQAPIDVAIDSFVFPESSAGVVPIEIGDVSGRGLGGYQFTLLYDSSILTIDGVSVDGTLSSGMFVSSNTTSPGEFRVVAAGAGNMTGEGTLINLTLELLAEGSSSLTWNGFFFDNTAVTASLSDGLITVLPAGQPPAAQFTASPTTGAPPLQVAFDATSSSDPDNDIVQYAWDMGDGSELSGVLVNHTYTFVGSYEVSLTVTDSQGNSDIEHIQIEVAQPPAPPIAGFAHSYNGLELSVDASTSSTPDVNGTSYFWSWGDGNSGSGRTATHRYAQNGEYLVVLRLEDSFGQISTSEQTIKVNRPPQPIFTYSFLSSQQVSFDASGSSDPDGDDLFYHWSFGDGTFGAGITTVKTFTASESVLVTLTVQDAYGDSGSTSLPVGVDAEVPDELPERLSLDALFPNPLNRGMPLRLKVAIPNPTTGRIVVIDVAGRVAFERQLVIGPGHHEMVLPTSALSAGIYTLLFSPSAGPNQTSIFVVQ